MDLDNDKMFVSPEVVQYWRHVDFYIGGIEHAVGHLIYSRFWNKFLKDIGVVVEEEPFKKLVNQGMIQGRSNFVYRIKGTNKFVSYGLKDQYDVQPIHVDINMVHNDVLDIDTFRKSSPEYENAEFILEDGKYICGWMIEKMSKSKYNVVVPDDIIEEYGADTLRLYEMFLGPIEQSKPWNTQGIEGVHRFLKKFWRLFFNKNKEINLSDEKPTKEELKVLHKTIKKVTGDIERLSYNTAISEMMICVNNLEKLKTNKKEILLPLLVILSPFAPHITEELWHLAGQEGSITQVSWPDYNEDYIKEDTITYPVAFNGKMRFKVELDASMPKEEIEKFIRNHEKTAKYTESKTIVKIIVVPKKIINIVVK